MKINKKLTIKLGIATLITIAAVTTLTPLIVSCSSSGGTTNSDGSNDNNINPQTKTTTFLDESEVVLYPKDVHGCLFDDARRSMKILLKMYTTFIDQNQEQPSYIHSILMPKSEDINLIVKTIYEKVFLGYKDEQIIVNPYLIDIDISKSTYIRNKEFNVVLENRPFEIIDFTTEENSYYNNEQTYPDAEFNYVSSGKIKLYYKINRYWKEGKLVEKEINKSIIINLGNRLEPKYSNKIRNIW